MDAMIRLLLILYAVICLGFGEETSIEKLNKFGNSILESYWESYAGLPYGTNNCRPENLTPNEFDPTDYAISLNQIPSDSINIINIAYATVDFYNCEGCRSCPYQSCKWLSACGLHLFEKDDNSDVTRFEQLKADIKELQSKGVLVKLSYGGEEWGNTDLLGSYQGRARHNVIYAAQQIARTVEELDLDGVDLNQKEGCGSDWYCFTAIASLQLDMLEQLRKYMPNKIISYTYPGYTDEVGIPYREVLKYGHQYLNTINVYRAIDANINDLNLELGVPRSKILWGFYIGCYHENIHVEEAMAYAEKAKSSGLAGVMVWSINKDTNHRFEHPYDGACTPTQTGLPDGTYHEAIGQVMHSD